VDRRAREERLRKKCVRLWCRAAVTEIAKTVSQKGSLRGSRVWARGEAKEGPGSKNIRRGKGADGKITNSETVKQGAPGSSLCSKSHLNRDASRRRERGNRPSGVRGSFVLIFGGNEARRSVLRDKYSESQLQRGNRNVWRSH